VPKGPLFPRPPHQATLVLVGLHCCLNFNATPTTSPITITLPNLPALDHMAEGDLRLDLACGTYAAGHLSRQSAADVAGVSRFDFDQALFTRRIPTFTEEMLMQDLETLRVLSAP